MVFVLFIVVDHFRVIQAPLENTLADFDCVFPVHLGDIGNGGILFADLIDEGQTVDLALAV